MRSKTTVVSFRSEKACVHLEDRRCHLFQTTYVIFSWYLSNRNRKLDQSSGSERLSCASSICETSTYMSSFQSETRDVFSLSAHAASSTLTACEQGESLRCRPGRNTHHRPIWGFLSVREDNRAVNGPLQASCRINQQTVLFNLSGN